MYMVCEESQRPSAQVDGASSVRIWDEEKFIRIMLHANADSIEWEYLLLDRTP